MVAAQAGVDRKTARRYVAAGVVRDGGVEQLTDEVVGQVVAAVRPARAGGHGQAWEASEAQRELISEWVSKDLSVAKIADLLARRGVLVQWVVEPVAGALDTWDDPCLHCVECASSRRRQADPHLHHDPVRQS